MNASELITIIREDYLNDTFNGWESATDDEKEDQFLWTDKFLLRSLSEAQRQACNRTDFLYDDSSVMTQIKMIENQSTYKISQKITFIEYASFDGTEITHYSKDEFNNKYPSWRADTGMTDKVVSYVMRGHSLRVHPTPDIDDVDKIISLEVNHLPIDDITSIADDFVIPEENHRDLIWWTLFEAFGQPDADGYDPTRSELYLDKFDEVFGEYVSSEVRLNQLNENKVLTLRPNAYTTNMVMNNETEDNDW